MELSEVYANAGERGFVFTARHRIPHLSSPAPLRWPSVFLFFFSNIPAFPLVPPSSSAPLPKPPCPPTSPSQTLPFSVRRPPPPRHLTTRCGNPITHVRIPAGQEEGGPEGGRMWTEHNCVKARGLGSRQLDTLHFFSFFGPGQNRKKAFEGSPCAQAARTPEPLVTLPG